jgi:hypothetical protein
VRRAFPAIVATLLVGVGCATIGELDLSDEKCAATFRSQIASILVSQGEKEEDALALGQRATVDLGFDGPGLRPFVIGSRTTDYTFFVQKKTSACLLRLLSRERGFTVYANNITYIETRELPACRCIAE